jgi:DNA/RNA-binding domain of Phe-tRNA-synthetase-like protein
MEFKTNRETLRKIQGIKLGILKVSNLNLMSPRPYFDIEFEAIKTYLLEKFKDKRPAEDDTVSHVRRMYRRVGWEPTRYRPSSEALVRRILKGKELYRINIAVDFGNLVSARHHLPMGLYDCNKISGVITLDTGKDGESYEGISKPLIHAQNKLILRDDTGIFGNPTADSKRTSLADTTKEVIAVFFCPYDVIDDYLNSTLDLLEKYYKEFSNINYREIKKFKI